MATSDFLPVNTNIYKFSQYTQSTVASFSTQFNTDWASILGGTVQLLATTAAPTQAIFRVPNNGPVLYINGGQARIPTDGATTNGSPVVTSATANFTQSDVGGSISGTGIPGSTTILSVQSPTQATMSANATATATGVSITITPTAGDYVGFNPLVGWQVIPAHQMSTFYVATTN